MTRTAAQPDRVALKVSRVKPAWVKRDWRQPLAAVVVTMAAGGLTGCGGGESPAAAARNGIRDSVGTYVKAIAKHDAARACNVITGAYWSSAILQLVVELRSSAYAGLSRETCLQALTRLYAGSRPSASVPKFAVSNVHVNGRVATAHLTIGTSQAGGSSVNARFVKAPSGTWQLDCCAGSALVQHPPNLPR